MATQETTLHPTKGSIKVKGQISGLSAEKSFRSGRNKNGAEYQSISFFVTTNKYTDAEGNEVENKVKVELYGQVNEFVYPYKPAPKGSPKGTKGTSIKHPFAQRYSLPQGFHLIGVKTKFNVGGEMKSGEYVDFDAVGVIKSHLKDGDFVEIYAESRYSEYTNENSGETKLQTQYSIKSIEHIGEIDFSDANFEELSSFKQEIVFIAADHDKQIGKTVVTGRVIAYGEKFYDVQFMIDPNIDPAVKALAATFLNKNKQIPMKFGTKIEVKGRLINYAIKEQVEAPALEVGWGIDVPGFSGYVQTNYFSELQILGAEPSSYEPDKYTEDDFVNKGLNTKADQETEEDNPFANPIDISDDDLPF